MKNNAPSLPVPTESVEQQCLFRWAAFQSGRFPELALLYHVPNGGSRKKAEAGRFRAEGVRRVCRICACPSPAAVFTAFT